VRPSLALMLVAFAALYLAFKRRGWLQRCPGKAHSPGCVGTVWQFPGAGQSHRHHTVLALDEGGYIQREGVDGGLC
jgi:hypothetical protein